MALPLGVFPPQHPQGLTSGKHLAPAQVLVVSLNHFCAEGISGPTEGFYKAMW